MHRRTKATAISMETKKIVYKRDGGACIFCHRPGLPEAHVVSRAQGGMGIPENIVTVCRSCHHLMDQTVAREYMIPAAEEYLKQFYPGWNEEEVTYQKWPENLRK